MVRRHGARLLEPEGGELIQHLALGRNRSHHDVEAGDAIGHHDRASLLAHVAVADLPFLAPAEAAEVGALERALAELLEQLGGDGHRSPLRWRGDTGGLRPRQPRPQAAPGSFRSILRDGEGHRDVAHGAGRARPRREPRLLRQRAARPLPLPALEAARPGLVRLGLSRALRGPRPAPRRQPARARRAQDPPQLEGARARHAAPRARRAARDPERPHPARVRLVVRSRARVRRDAVLPGWEPP